MEVGRVERGGELLLKRFHRRVELRLRAGERGLRRGELAARERDLRYAAHELARQLLELLLHVFERFHLLFGFLFELGAALLRRGDLRAQLLGLHARGLHRDGLRCACGALRGEIHVV